MFLESFKEEWQALKTKKINWVVLFVLPVLVVILIGVELDDEVIANIPMAVIDHDQSDFSRQLIDAFAQNTVFNVISYPESDIALEQLMKDSVVRVGMVIPTDFYDDVATLQSPSVLMLYDGSHMSMTSAAKSTAMEILLTYKAGATISQLTARLGMTQEEAYNVAQVFQFRNRTLYNPSKSFEDFLAPVLMAGYLQAAMVLVASVSVNHSIYTKKRSDRVGYGLGKAVFYALAGSLSFILCVMLQVGIFGMPFEGRFIDVYLLSLALCFAAASFSVIISAVIGNRMISLLGGGIIFIPNSIMAGTTWPVTSMPLGYQGFAAYMPFAKFANNLRNIYLKGTTLTELQPDIFYLCLFGLISVGIAESVLWIAAVEDHEPVDKEVSKNDLPKYIEEGV